MTITDLEGFTFYADTITVNGHTCEDSGITLDSKLSAVQYHKGNNYCLEEPLMTKVPSTKYQYAVDKYFEVETVKKVAQNLVDNPPYIEPTLDEKIQTLKNDVQTHLDTTAQSLGFDDINSISKFLSLSTSIFYADANNLNIWQNSVWEWIEPELHKVLNGIRTMPTRDEALIEIPKFN